MEKPVTNRDIMNVLTKDGGPPLPEWGPNRIMKQRAQVKSKFYYIFWGIATVSVVLGQLYVGQVIERMQVHYLEYLIVLK